jgi:hypothetical protein
VLPVWNGFTGHMTRDVPFVAQWRCIRRDFCRPIR